MNPTAVAVDLAKKLFEIAGAPVAVKWAQQQALQALHHRREAWKNTRTRRIKTLRGPINRGLLGPPYVSPVRVCGFYADLIVCEA